MATKANKRERVKQKMLPKLEPFSPRQSANRSLQVSQHAYAQQLASQEVIPSQHWQLSEHEKVKRALLPSTVGSRQSHNLSKLIMDGTTGKVNSKGIAAASGYYKFKTDAAKVAAERPSQNQINEKDRNKSGEMRATIENMYSKYRDKRVGGGGGGGGMSARPNLVTSSHTVGLKQDLVELLPRLKSKVERTKVKQIEPKTTHPTQAGFVNLRIKSSKAFPMSEVSVIEELISKFKRHRAEKGTHKQLLPMGAQLDLVNLSQEAVDWQKDRAGNSMTIVKFRNDADVVKSSANQADLKKAQSAKPYSYEFLKQQMRDVKRQVSQERKSMRQQRALNQIPSQSSIGMESSKILTRIGSLELIQNEYLGVKAGSVSPEGRDSQVVPGGVLSRNPSLQKMSSLESRATSLPKIAQKQNMSQHQMIALTERESSVGASSLPKMQPPKWDHSKLIDVKGMLEQRSILDSAGKPTTTGFLTQSMRTNLQKVESNRSLFNSRQAAGTTQQGELTQQQALRQVSSNPYLSIHEPKDDQQLSTIRTNPNSTRRHKESGHNLESMLQNLTVERQAYLTALLEVQSQHKAPLMRENPQAYPQAAPSVTQTASPNRGPQFRFHKNLATSRYEEFLAESDDEEFFNSQPRTKKGRNFELDFKIDTYRDEIKFNKNGNQKKLIKVQIQGQYKPAHTFHTSGYHQEIDPAQMTAMVQSDVAVFATHPDFSPAMQAFGSSMSIERYKKVEDLIQIPYHEEMGTFNHTVLRCSDATFRINVAEMNHMKIATTKQMKEANRVMLIRNQQPVFTGNVQSYLVNQLAEYELICKVRNLMSRLDTNKTNCSSVYPYYQRLFNQANTQFVEVAAKISTEMQANIALAREGNNVPTTPQVELAKTQAAEKKIDILKSKDHLQGVYIRKQQVQTGQKPCCRISMDIVPIGNKFITYGGVAARVFNDIRSIDSLDYVWKVLKEDTEQPDFQGRFGHSCCSFERYVIIFGGCGPYSKKLKKRACFWETIAFDVETGKYCKFDGGPASLQAEISELRQLNKIRAKGLLTDDSNPGSLAQNAQEQQQLKSRISAISLVSTQAKLETDAWMSMRKRAVVDMPEARAHHAGVVFGCGLFIHGGQSAEGNTALSDWNLFDFELQVWMKLEVKEVAPGESLQSSFTFARKYHTMTPVVEPSLNNGRELSRLLWVSPMKELTRKPKSIEQGIYVFGGIDENSMQTDDLFWLYPDYKQNGKNISKKQGEYKPTGMPEVRFNARRLKPEGRGPIARSQHSATFFKNQLIIFGGRNDAIFPVIKNVALNDLHIYDCENNRWAAIAMYGDMPGSRWGHRLVANESKLMLFGGMNLTSYCESVLYDIHIDDGAVYDFLMRPSSLKVEQTQKFDTEAGGTTNLQITMDGMSSENLENGGSNRYSTRGSVKQSRRGSRCSSKKGSRMGSAVSKTHRMTHQNPVMREQLKELDIVASAGLLEASRLSSSTVPATQESKADKKARAIIEDHNQVRVPIPVVAKINERGESAGADDTEELRETVQDKVHQQLKVMQNEIMHNSGQTAKTDRTAERLLKLQEQVEEHSVREATFEGKHELLPGTSPAVKQRKERKAEKGMTKEDFKEILMQTEKIELLNMPPKKPKKKPADEPAEKPAKMSVVQEIKRVEEELKE